MNYFVGAYFNSQLTGIEKAQVNRLKLFMEQGWPAECLYTKYNPRIHENAKKFGIQGKCFTLYDYFQEAVADDQEQPKDWVRFWQETCHFRLEFVDIAPDIRVFDECDRFIMYAHFTGKDYQWPVYINYFDRDHQKVQRDIYDSRGFLSQSKFLRKQQRVQSELFFNRQGQIKVEKTYQEINERTTLKRIILRSYQQRDYFFDTEAELQTFFFNNLFEAGDVYFCDKNGYIGQALADTASDIPVCAVFHSTHAREQDDVVQSPLKSPYRVPLAKPEKFSHFIVSTELQKQDLLARFDKLPTISVIPVGYVGRIDVDFKKKKVHRIIGVARFSPEKQVLHQIRVIERLATEFPDIELHLFGFGGQSEEQKLRDYVEQHKLKNHVFFRGFVPNLAEEYAQASLEMVTSKEEGFSLTTLEALSHGVPVVSYNINYGPTAMIEDNINGNLVERDNLDELYRKVRDYLRDPQRQSKYMGNSVRIAENYSKAIVARKWGNLLEEMAH